MAVTMPTGTEVKTTATRGGIKADLDPNAKEAQLLTVKEGVLAGVSVAFPVGSLSIPVTISVTPGASLNNNTVIQNIGVQNNTVRASGTPVEITASKAIDLRSPMILAIPIPKKSNLIATSTNRQNLAVLYRVKVAEGTDQGSFTGIVPASSLGWDDDKVLYPTKFFGWFSVIELETPITKSVEVKARYADQLAAMRFTTTADLPACTSSDIDRIAYVSSENRMYYCSSSGSWVAIPTATSESSSEEESSAPVRLLKNGQEIGRILSAGSPWKIMFDVGSSSYLVDITIDSADPAVGILSTDISSYLDSTNTGKPSETIYFSGADCTGSAYTYTSPVKWVSKPKFVASQSSATTDGTWYRYSSNTPQTVTYQSALSSGSYCSSYTSTYSLYPLEVFTGMPIPFYGTWSVE